MKWTQLIKASSAKHAETVKIGVVAKYLDNEDTYISVVEALKAAAWQEKVNLDIVWIAAETATDDDFAAVDGLLVPGGFGERGVEGKIAAASFALMADKPYLGICLGLQVAVIAAARAGGLSRANSSEVDKNTPENVVYIMAGQEGKQSTGGTLRLGDFPAQLQPSSLAAKLYGQTEITERHRHRYEVNRAFETEITAGGLVVSGQSPDGSLVEFVEAPAKKFFIATQAHPEFRSRPDRPHPLFAGLIRAALASRR